MSSTILHTIRRNGKLEYRVGSDVGLDYRVDGKLEEPFSSLDVAVTHAIDIEFKMGHLSPNETLAEAVARKIEFEKGRITYDLDSYVSTVKIITQPEFAAALLLGKKEVEVLQEVAKYLMRELKYPQAERHPENVLGKGDLDEGELELSRFRVTVDKLTDVNNTNRAKPDPNLSPGQVKALNKAHDYVRWLADSYPKAETCPGKPIYK